MKYPRNKQRPAVKTNRRGELKLSKSESMEQGEWCDGCENYQRGVVKTPNGNLCPECR